MSVFGTIVETGIGETIDLRGFPSGLYLVNVQGTIRKIIKN